MKSDLLQLVEAGGCSAKISPGQLDTFLKYLPLPEDQNILVSIDTHDDAGVYRINEDLALVFTTDFFPPVCSDPYEFGQIAAANSISDIYSMGGTPVIALNLMMFPVSKLPLQSCAEILKGGYDVASQAGMRIIGGHTIEDPVPKYGMAVVGYVQPDRIIKNSGAKPGDMIILTKPLGTGIILAGQRLKITSEADAGEAMKFMKMLNNRGAEVMKKNNVKGATDITGYGLAGHALKMAKASNVSIDLFMSRVPLIGDTLRLTEEGCIPGAAFRNLEFVEHNTLFAPDIGYSLKMIAMDAQTSGGLLMCVPAEKADNVISTLCTKGMDKASVIGRVTELREKHLYLYGNG
jgi:selenide,water dikinase